MGPFGPLVRGAWSGVSVRAPFHVTRLKASSPDDGRYRAHRQIRWRRAGDADPRTAPIDLGSVPADGKEIDVTARGTLTLHGVTKDVQIALKARLSGSVIVVIGSLPIAFADYSIQAPSSFKVLSVDNYGTMELQLFFSHA